MNTPLGRTSSLGTIDPGTFGPSPDPGASFATAHTRDEVVDAILAALQPIAHGVGVFVARKHGFEGWRCTSELADPGRFQGLRVMPEAGCVLGEAAVQGRFVGVVPPGPPNDILNAVLAASERAVAIAPVKIGERCVMLVLCIAQDTEGIAREGERVASEAGKALTRILASEKRSR